MKREHLLAFLKENKSFFEKKYGVTKLGIFGSYANDKARDDSDVDIAIEMKREHKYRNFFALQIYLEDHLHRKIDLGIESQLKPLVRDAIKDEIIYV